MRRLNLGLVLPIIGIAVGLGLLGWLFSADYIAKLGDSASRTAMVDTAGGSASDPERIRQKEQADLFNEAIAYGASNGALPYEEQLTYGDNGYIALIQIPKINIDLPIYREDSDDAGLSAGAMHVRGTSLPVGGESTHTAISAHSGSTNARMFDDIRKLSVGDRFVIWSLNEPKAYQVDSTEVVEPNDVSSLAVSKGEDLCTLITCTPYGVNSHRLLVHSHAVPYDPSDFELTPIERLASVSDIRLLILLIAISATSGGIAFALARKGR